MTSTSKPTTDPYQWFFPIGLIFGGLGTGIWIANWKPGLSWFPGPAHADLMMGGFFITIAVGFLMTAIPKFTGTNGASVWEKMAVASAAGLGLAFAYAQSRLPFHVAIFVMTLMLMIFALRRFRQASFRTPPPFAFLGFGIASAVVSSFIMLLQDMHPLPLPLLILGRQLYLYGVSLFLILGVGTQLLPFLMGMVNTDAVEARTPFHIRKGLSPVGMVLLWGILLMMTFVLDAAGLTIMARLGRAAVVAWILIMRWRILHWPKAGTVLAIMIWSASWMMVLGLVVMAAFPTFAIHGAHIYFIGGISTMIFAVATRVSLAHGGHGLAMERRSKVLITILVLLGIALVTRVTAPWFPKVYNSHLAYAAIPWILAAVCWGVGVSPKIWCRKSGG